MCYFLRLKTPRVTLKNAALGKQFTLEWSQETLPHFVEWKSMAAGDYALGLEPCTTELNERFSFATIEKGEKRLFSLKLSVQTK